jgi:hypothetical protein
MSKPREADELKLPANVALDSPAMQINRETSWLAFNARVLGQAQANHNPPLECLKFIAIPAANSGIASPLSQPTQLGSPPTGPILTRRMDRNNRVMCARRVPLLGRTP